MIQAYFKRLYLLYLSFLVNTAVISRWKSFGKSSRTTKYLTRLDTVWVIITAVIINFFKSYLRGFRKQGQKLNIIYSNTVFATIGMYLI